MVKLGWVSFASKVSVPNFVNSMWFYVCQKMIQRTNPSWSKWNSLYLEKSHTVPWNLMVFLAGVSRLFLRFWWNYPKNYEITWVIRFTENRPKITKTEPRSCKIYTKDLNFPLSPSSRLGPGLIHKYQTSWSVLEVNSQCQAWLPVLLLVETS